MPKPERRFVFDLLVVIFAFLVFAILGQLVQNRIEPQFFYSPDAMHVHDYCPGDDMFTVQVVGYTDNGRALTVVYSQIVGNGVRYDFPERVAHNAGSGVRQDFDFPFRRSIDPELLPVGEYRYNHTATSVTPKGETLQGPVSLPFTVEDCET